MLLVLLAALLGLVLAVAGITLRQREAPQRLLLILLGILLLLVAGWLYLDRAPEQRAERRTWAPATPAEPLAMDQAFSDAVGLPDFAEDSDSSPSPVAGAESAEAENDGANPSTPAARSDKQESRQASRTDRPVDDRPAPARKPSSEKQPAPAAVPIRDRSMAAKQPRSTPEMDRAAVNPASKAAPGKSKGDVHCCGWQPVPELRDYPTLDYQAGAPVYVDPAPARSGPQQFQPALPAGEELACRTDPTLGAPGLCVIVRNRLGPRQQREVLRLFVEGRPVGRYELNTGQPSMNLPIQFSRPGRYGYRLVGYVDYPEGRAQLNSTGVFDVRPGAVFDVMIDELRDTVFLEHDPYSRAVTR